MKLSLKIICAAALIIVMSGSLSAQQNELYTIEPGWRVGPIIMTMTQDDIERVYGKGEVFSIPDKDRTVRQRLVQYKNLGLNFIFRNQTLQEIEINYPNFSLKNLVRVGSSVSQAEQVLGKNYIRENYQHAYEVHLPDYRMIYGGIILYVKNERIVKISVTKH